jgi:hypothetical protein
VIEASSVEDVGTSRRVIGVGFGRLGSGGLWAELSGARLRGAGLAVQCSSSVKDAAWFVVRGPRYMVRGSNWEWKNTRNDDLVWYT